MIRREICQLCSDNGRFESAMEIAKIHSNVRIWKKHETTVWRCPSCGSLHCLENVNLATFYEDYPYGKRQLDKWLKKVFGRFQKRLDRFGLKADSEILDYGCSQGLFLSYLQEKGFVNCTGYDPHVADFRDVRVLDREYDFVISQDVIEHVEEPETLFRSLTDCVRPGGVLCIGTPRADDIDLGNPEMFIHSLHQPYHIHIFSESALLSLGARNGLILERLYRRHIFDTLLPFVNWTFIHGYLAKLDNTLDAGFEPPKISMMMTSPSLIFKGLFGYLLPIRSEMIVFFRKQSVTHVWEGTNIQRDCNRNGETNLQHVSS